MFLSITESRFIDAFQAIRPDNFTYEGLRSLFAWIEDYETDTGETIELDPIAICCEFSEYANLEEFQADYGNKYETIEDIEDQTTIIPIDDNAFIIQSF